MHLLLRDGGSIKFLCKFYSDSPERRERKKGFLLVRKRFFEFSCFPKQTFTSGAIYGSKAEIFSGMPDTTSLVKINTQKNRNKTP